MHDSDLLESGLLARLLHEGMLLLGESGDLLYASDRARRLLGAASPEAFSDAWHDVGAQLRIDEWPRRGDGATTWHGRADVHTPGGVRGIRYEMHASSAGNKAQRAMLVRDRGALDDADRALLLAGKAETDRHVLAGLVHAAKGPLNNFNLTLTLLAAGIGGTDAKSVPAALLERLVRYLDVLRSEAARLAACIERFDSLNPPAAHTPEAIDLGAMLRDCAELLRHGVTVRELTLDLDVPDEPVHARGDAHLIRVALLAFTVCLLDLTPSGGRVRLRIAEPRGNAIPTIGIATSQAPLPSALVADLFRLAQAAQSAYPAAIAARMIVEAQGGDVALDDESRSPGFFIRLPARN